MINIYFSLELEELNLSSINWYSKNGIRYFNLAFCCLLQPLLFYNMGFDKYNRKKQAKWIKEKLRKDEYFMRVYGCEMVEMVKKIKIKSKMKYKNEKILSNKRRKMRKTIFLYRLQTTFSKKNLYKHSKL